MEKLSKKDIVEGVLKVLNSYEYMFKYNDAEEINNLKMCEYETEDLSKRKNTDEYEVLFIKEVYNEYLDKTVEIYLINKNNKESIDYIAREYTRSRFGDKHYSEFYKVKRKDIKTTVWEFSGDKFYEE